MITVVKTINGTYNVFGVEDDMFVLQGNLTLDQLRQLKVEVDNAVNEAANWING